MSELQIVLIIVIVVLTMLLIIVGVQVLFIILAIKRVIRKVEGMLEGKDRIEDVVTKERIQKAMSYIRSKLPFKR
jgi:hypothetical protein